MNTIEEIRKVIADINTPYDSRIAAVARLVAPLVEGQAVGLSATVDTGAHPGDEVFEGDSDGDVRVRIAVGSFEEHLYIPVTELRR